MTLLLERSPALDEGFERDARRGLDGALVGGDTAMHDRLTLDDLIISVWEGLAVRDAVNCPVCASPMAMRSPGGCDGPLEGICESCGSRLS
jgi:hypothetical protein